jgi:hypothetical protein
MVDMDSILFPILEAMASRPGGEGIRVEDIHTWETLPKLIAGGVPRMLQMFDEVMPFAAMAGFPPPPGAIAGMQALRAHGCELHVKTDRPERFAGDVARYLDHFSVPYDTLLCAPGIDKLALCQEEGIEVLVDDHPALLERAHDAGLDCLSLHYPYLDELVGRQGLKTAHSWLDLAEHVAGAVEGRVERDLAARDA